MRVQTFSRAQILQEFCSHCQQLAASDNRGFIVEFEELNEVGTNLSKLAGNLEPNREKNRYPYILPYDHCRVRLSFQNSHPHSDYINANFVPGGGTERDFICTQGPLKNTVADFWRMVWEQNVRIIVMVTALRHKDLVLCEKYWPLDRGTVYHGQIQVTTVNRKRGPDYFVTTINLRQRHCPTDRIITHYYYPSWPDRGVPKDPSSLCVFTEHIRQDLEASPRLGPAVVHCSAGVGRSGTFVTLLWLMQLCVRGIRPDVRAAVEDLRLHRMWMVQNLKMSAKTHRPGKAALCDVANGTNTSTRFVPLSQTASQPSCPFPNIWKEQYIFVHQCLLHWLRGASAGLQTPMAVPHTSISTQNEPSSQGNGTRRRRRRHHRQTPPSSQPQSPVQHILNPANLLRRLLPSSSLFSSSANAS